MKNILDPGSIHSFIHPINIYLAPYCVRHCANDGKRNPTTIPPSWSLSSNGRDNRQENTYISRSSNKYYKGRKQDKEENDKRNLLMLDG